MVADAIKSHKFNPADVLSFICSELGNPSVKLGKDDWKDIIKKAIKRGGLVGKCLEACAGVLKGKNKVSNEDLFSAVVSACGENPELLMSELYLNKVGWMKVADTLVKTKGKETVETVKVETKAGKKAAKKTKKSIKVTKVDPRSKSITLFNEKTEEMKTWPSYRACEKELYGEKKGHGMVSQLLDPKKGLKHLKGGWVLLKEEEAAPVESKKRAPTALSPKPPRPRVSLTPASARPAPVPIRALAAMSGSTPRRPHKPEATSRNNHTNLSL